MVHSEKFIYNLIGFRDLSHPAVVSVTILFRRITENVNWIHLSFLFELNHASYRALIREADSLYIQVKLRTETPQVSIT